MFNYNLKYIYYYSNINLVKSDKDSINNKNNNIPLKRYDKNIHDDFGYHANQYDFPNCYCIIL